jgi:hypothetical protein
MTIEYFTIYQEKFPVIARGCAESRSPDGAQRNPGLASFARENRITLRSIRATLAVPVARVTPGKIIPR